MRPVLIYAIVFVGAGIGGAMRHGVNTLAMRYVSANIPIGTWAVNLIGSLLIGALAGVFALKSDPGQTWRLFLVTGVLGGFTTFSAFSLDAVLLLERGDFGVAAVYIGTSVFGAMMATFVALTVVKAFA